MRKTKQNLLPFDMNAGLKNTNLPDLNDFLKAYANFDVHEGTFGLYTEVASKDGKFIGYVKSVIKNLNVTGPEGRCDLYAKNQPEKYLL